MRLDEQVEWEKISTERERPPLPANTYLCLVTEVTDDITQTSQLPRTTIVAVVQEGEFKDREIWDQIIMKTKKGGTNKAGMGQIKEWAEATVGLTRLASPDFDTKEFEGNTVKIITEMGSYQVDDPSPTAAPGKQISKPKTVIKKVLKA